MFGEVSPLFIPNGWWFMPASPAPADPGRDDDLAWLDRDPERDCWLDRAREHDEPPEPDEYEDYAPLTAEELAEIRQAAADELLAVEAASTGRRAGRGGADGAAAHGRQPGGRRPVESPDRRPDVHIAPDVQTHLAHVFAKLGLTSRAQLAAEATRQEAP
jgi:hypothetical protein